MVNGDLDGPPAGDGLGDALDSVDGVSVLDADGEPLGSVTVVPKGVGEASGPMVVPGSGVAVGGTEVGRGVGLAVAGGGGGGVGAGVGVGAVTTTGFGASVVGLLPALVTELNTTVHVPAGRAAEPVHVPESRGSVVDNDVVRVVEPLDATALTLMAVSVALPRYSTEKENWVVGVPVSGVT